MEHATIEEIDQAVAGETAPRRFLKTVADHPDVVALRAQQGELGQWAEWTFREYADLVARAAAGLQQYGVQPGDRVLLMMRNRPDFHWLDTAAQFLRATPVSIYNSSSPEEIAYLAGHAGAKLAILEDAGFLRKVLEVRADLPEIEHLFVLQPPEALPDGVMLAGELLERGELDLAALAEATQPDDLATLIYTSGTTGPPKGVMIDQHNVVYTAEQLRRCIAFEEYAGRRLISYLPMAHIAERMTSHYQHMIHGFTITCCPEPGQIAAFARETHPEVLFGVPRVWEKVYAGVRAALEADPERKRQFDDGVAAALEIKAAERAGTATDEQRETWAFLDAVAFSTVRQLTGLDSVIVAISGAAPISHEILEWFNAVGVPLSEIYGMSESSGPMTWAAYDIKPGTVGPAIPGCDVVIADDGEVICRGGNVFRGYYNDEQKTAEALIDGWLHSGDIGEMDEDGYVRIVDRKKELIITSGGKNISPANLESALKMIPLVGQAAAIGDNRKFVSALLVLDAEVAPVWAKANGIEVDTLEELAENPAVIAEVQAGVDDVNAQFAQVEQIKRFTLLGEEWQPDSDVLTPTSKLKRRGIAARYADAIEAMYAVSGPSRLLAHGFGLVEGPTVGPEGELYVSDVLRGGVHRIDRDGEVTTVIPKRRGVGGIALHADGGLVVSGRDVQHVRDGEIRTLLAPDGHTGFNDLCCDAEGRVVVGGLRFMVFDPEATPVPGELLRVDRPNHADALADGIVHSNGVGVTADGRTIFHSDTRGGRVVVLGLDESGAVVNRLDVTMEGPGFPDGLAVDAGGCAWVAMVGDGAIVRLRGDGTVLDRLPVPARSVTSLCFRDGELIVVSADNTEDPSLRGSVFSLPTDMAGAPVHPARI